MEFLNITQLRDPSSNFDPNVAYGHHPSIFTVRLNHGGRFTSKVPGRRYLGGSVNFFDWVDEDKFSAHELNDMVQILGYPTNQEIYYQFMIPDSNLDYGLRAVGNDTDVLNMLQYVKRFKILDVFTEHWTTSLDTYFMSPSKVVIEELIDEVGPSNVISNRKGKLRPLALEWHGDESDDDMADDDSDDSDFLVDEDNMVDDLEVDMQDFRSCVDNDVVDGLDGNNNEACDEIDLEDFDSLSDEDNDTPLKRCLRKLRKEKRYAIEVAERFFVGQQFTDKKQIKRLVETHALETRRQLKIIRNDLGRFRVICKGNESNAAKKGVSEKVVGGKSPRKKCGAQKRNPCPWILHISNTNKEGTIQGTIQDTIQGTIQITIHC